MSYAELVEFNFRMHLPTEVDRQGPDRGTQYRTAIFTTDDAQAEIAKKVRTEVQEAHYPNEKIATSVSSHAHHCATRSRARMRGRHSFAREPAADCLMSLGDQIEPAGEWYSAEEYHQKYLDINPNGYECPTHRLYW